MYLFWKFVKIIERLVLNNARIFKIIEQQMILYVYKTNKIYEL